MQANRCEDLRFASSTNSIPFCNVQETILQRFRRAHVLEVGVKQSHFADPKNTAALREGMTGDLSEAKNV